MRYDLRLLAAADLWLLLGKDAERSPTSCRPIANVLRWLCILPKRNVVATNNTGFLVQLSLSIRRMRTRPKRLVNLFLENFQSGATRAPKVQKQIDV